MRLANHLKNGGDINDFDASVPLGGDPLVDEPDGDGTCPDDGCQTQAGTDAPMAASGGNDTPTEGASSDSGSTIDNHTFAHIHAVDDYRVVSPSGCQPCGTSNPDIGALPTLRLQRIHRYRDLDRPSSFGPGVFLNYDLSVSCESVAGKTALSLWDPRDRQAIELSDPDSDGVFSDASRGAIAKGALYNAAGSLVSDHLSAATAQVTTHAGVIATFEFIRTGVPSSTERSGRLTRISDRNGHSIVLTYKFAASDSDATLVDRAKLWQINTIIDAHGNVATIQYRSTPIAGRWPISAIGLPTGQSIDYAYGGNRFIGLTSVTLPDQSTSTFGLGSDKNSQTTTITFDDARSDGVHRRKVAHYSRIAWANPKSGELVSLPLLRTRRIVNNAGEAVYANWTKKVGSNVVTNVVSAGKTVQLTTAPISGAPLLSATAIDGAWNVRPLRTYNSVDAQKRVLSHTDALNRQTSFQRDSRHGAITQATFPDLTKENVAYNQFRQVLTSTDRLGNQTVYTYDAAGNILTKTAANGTVDRATWTWRYGEAGSNARPGQPSSTIDANGNVTKYVYDAKGYLSSVIEPVDGPEQAVAPTRSFTYDNAGRMTSATDAEQRTTTYAYDAVNRLIATNYVNATSDRIGYGTSAAGTANLVVWTSDRNNVHAVNQYDAAGRLTATYSGLLLSVGKNSSANLADYANVADASVTTTAYLASTLLPRQVTVNGTVTTYEYDNDLREISRSTRTQNSNLLDETVYDNADRIDIRRHSHMGTNLCETFYVYDNLDRVTRTITEATSTALNSLTVAQRTALTRLANVNAAYVITDDAYEAGTAYGPSTLVNGRIADVRIHTDELGTKSVRAYDHQGRLAETLIGQGLSVAQRTVFTHDPQGNITKVYHPRHFTEAGGFITSLTYGGRNLERDRTVAFGRPEATTSRKLYGQTGQIETLTVAFGTPAAASTVYTYCNCCDWIQSITDPDGFIRSFTYDGVGRVIAVTDPLNHVTSTQYDARGRVVKKTNALGQATSIAYDDNAFDAVGLSGTYAAAKVGLALTATDDGAMAAITDALGNTALTIFDSVGRPLRTVDANGNKTTVKFFFVTDGNNGWGVPLSTIDTTDALGNVTSQRIDGLNRLIAIKDADNKYTKFTYDAAGHRLSDKDPNNNGMSYTYDALGRRLASVDGLSVTTSQSYDAANNVIGSIDGEGKVSSAAYDGLNRPVSATDRIGAITSFAYDARGNRQSITDAQGGVTSYAYNLRDQLTGEAFPGSTGGIRQYAYDAAGRLASRVDEANITATYVYDNADRLTGRNYPDGLNDAFTYDAAGRLLTARSNRYDNTVSRAYDAAGRLTQEIQSIIGVNYTVGYAYDADNRITTITYPDGANVAHTYTKRDQLASVTLGGAQVATQAYDAGMRLTTTTLGNGVVETRAYRTDNLIQSISAPNVVDLRYGYNKTHSKTSEIDAILAANTQNFGYDAQQRLTSWSDGTTTQAWALSPVGDMNSVTTNGTTETRTHTPVHEISSLTTGTATLNLTYDAKGNLTTNANNATYGWDFENRLKSASISNADEGIQGTATYAYDALGRRVQKTVWGVTTTFVHDGARVIQESDAPEQLTATAANDEGSGTGTPNWGGILPSALTRVNFQPALTTVPDGFVADKGKLYGLRSNGKTYGWTIVPRTDTVARHEHPLPQYDTFNHMWKNNVGAAGVWEFAVPNGAYPVVVVMGDCVSKQQTNDIVIEGAPQADPDPFDGDASGYDRGDFDGYAAIANVTDGKLTITAGPGASDPKICFIEIGQAGGTLSQATRDLLADMVDSATDRTGGLAFAASEPSVRQYVYGDDYIDHPLMLVNAGQKYYYSVNHLYSVSALTDAVGGVVERYRYDAYGKRTVLSPTGVDMGSDSAFGNSVGFTGLRVDAETGLLFARNRMFDPGLGRWISRDPIGYVDGLSLYAGYFVPNGVDPSGLSSVCQAMLEALIKVAGQMRNEFDTYDAVSHSECPGQSELRDLKFRVDTLRDSVRNIGNIYGSLNCYQEAMNDLAMEARLRDLKIILDSTSQVTGYVPGAGQVVSRVAGGLSAGIDIYQGNYADGLMGLADSVMPGGKGKGQVSANLGMADDAMRNIGKLPRYNGPKPTYTVNPAHVPGPTLRPRKTPLPSDAQGVFKNAVPNDPNNPTAWFGRNANGETYRYSLGNDGTAHFSGIDGVGDGTRNLTNYAQDRLDGL